MGNFISYSRPAPSLFAPRRRLHFRPFVAFLCPAACISQLHFLAFLPLTRPNFSTRVTAAGISSFVYSLSFVLVFIASDRLEYSQHIKAGKQTPAPTNSNTSKSIEASPVCNIRCICFYAFPGFSQLTDMTVSGLADSPKLKLGSIIYCQSIQSMAALNFPALHAPQTIQCKVSKFWSSTNVNI